MTISFAHWLSHSLTVCDYRTSPSAHLRDRGLADLAQRLNSVERGQLWARLLFPILFLALPTVSVGRKHPDECGWKTQRRRLRKVPHTPHLIVCTHVHARAYIRGLNSLRQCINTHDAAGEEGRKVRVSQHITPPLSPSLPSVHLFFSLFLLQLYMCNCFCYHVSFRRENTEDFTWQANYDL